MLQIIVQKAPLEKKSCTFFPTKAILSSKTHECPRKYRIFSEWGKEKKDSRFSSPSSEKNIGREKKLLEAIYRFIRKKSLFSLRKRTSGTRSFVDFPSGCFFSFSLLFHGKTTMREREKTDEGAFHYADISANMRGRKKNKIAESSTLVCGWIKNDDDKGNIFLFITACKGRKAFALSCSLLPNMH